MTTLSTSDYILNAKNYHQITINTFQRYAEENFEDKHQWADIKIDFKP